MRAGPLYIVTPLKAGWPPWAITPDYTCTSMTENPPVGGGPLNPAGQKPSGKLTGQKPSKQLTGQKPSERVPTPQGMEAPKLTGPKPVT